MAHAAVKAYTPSTSLLGADYEDDDDFASREDSMASGVIVRYSYVEPEFSTGPLLSARGPAAASHLLSPMQTCVSIIKCAIGAGSFALPFAFFQGGVYMSFLLTLVLGAVSAYTIYMLGLCERKLVNRVLRESCMNEDPAHAVKTKLTYPEVGARAFPNFVVTINGTKYNVMSGIIYAGIVLTSLGVCAAFLNFITSTFAGILNGWSGGDSYDRGIVTAMVVPIMLMLAFLKSFKWLAFTSILGDIAVAAGLIAVIAYGGSKHGKDADMDHAFVRPATLPNFFGSTAFLFAIHIVVLPIMQNMREPKKFRAVVYTSYSFITLLNAFFGAAAYITFADTKCDVDKDDTYTGPCGNILDNINGGWVLDAIKLLVCVDLLFTLPMIFAASREIIEEAIVARFFQHTPYLLLGHREPKGLDLLRYFIRTALVGVVVAITFGVPQFENMVGLVGGFVNSVMGFVLPPIIYMKIVGSEKSTLWIAAHCAIVVFGMFALVVSTWFTLEAIIQG